MGSYQQRLLRCVADRVSASFLFAERLKLCPVCQLPTIMLVCGKRQCRNCGYIES